jgi:hypothetical protein
MACATSAEGHNETSSYESSSCLPSCRPGVTPLLCVHVHCTSTCQLASSCLQMFLNRASVSRFKAACVPVPQCQSLAVTGTLLPGPGLPSGGPSRRRHGWRWPDVRHQPPGDAKEKRGHTNLYSPGQSKR